MELELLFNVIIGLFKLGIFIYLIYLIQNIANSLYILANSQEKINKEILEQKYYNKVVMVDESSLTDEQREILNKF